MSAALALAGCGSSSSLDVVQSTHTQSGSSPTADSGSTSNPSTDDLKLQGFGVIREFGESDTAALFGLLANIGKIQITEVRAPSFLGGYRSGELNQAALDHLFQKTTNSMSLQERQELIAKYQGAEVIYFESYKEALCRADETEFHIIFSGNVNGRPFKATYHFVALPNPSGDCKYFKYGTMTEL